MNKFIFQKLLKASVKRKKLITNKSFISRLFSNPDMLIQTLFCFLLRKQNSFFSIKTKTFWGKKMNVLLPEVVSSDIRRFGFIEESVASFIINFASEGDCLIDVGAHFGFFSLLMADIVGKTGSVHSFEPTPSTFTVLKKNISFDNNIFINRNAIWDLDTEIELNDYGPSSSAFNSIHESRDKRKYEKAIKNKIKVKTLRLDDYVRDHQISPKLIKIDAESAEYQVLKGMDNILSKMEPLLCIELGDLGIEGVISSKKIIKFLMINYSYKPYEIKDGKLSLHKVKKNYKYTNLFFKK
tara:strand:+ start:28268 stop:29158 length:891 start_codon:yes stop_codon:yes gene_type:complete